MLFVLDLGTLISLHVSRASFARQDLFTAFSGCAILTPAFGSSFGISLRDYLVIIAVGIKLTVAGFSIVGDATGLSTSTGHELRRR